MTTSYFGPRQKFLSSNFAAPHSLINPYRLLCTKCRGSNSIRRTALFLPPPPGGQHVEPWPRRTRCSQASSGPAPRMSAATPATAATGPDDGSVGFPPPPLTGRGWVPFPPFLDPEMPTKSLTPHIINYFSEICCVFLFVSSRRGMKWVWK